LPFTSNGSSPSFSEDALESGSAVGAIGSSRESAIYWDGMLLPEGGRLLFPDETNFFRALLGGSPIAPVRKLGALLEGTKEFAEATTDMTTDVGAWGMVLEYNLFGDPSMPILRDQPSPIIDSAYSAHVIDNFHASLQSSQQGSDGAIVTLLENGQYVGRGVLTQGATTITTVAPIDPAAPLDVIIGGDPFTASEFDPFQSG
jgi:hypothetical protein